LFAVRDSDFYNLRFVVSLMTIPQFEEIVEQNDQTEARSEHLDKLRELVGNVYPNKFARSSISGGEDTISRLLQFEPVVAAGAEMAPTQYVSGLVPVMPLWAGVG